MLQRQAFTEQNPDEEAGFDLSLPYLWDLVKRRFKWFMVPFLVVLAVGSLVAWKWPAQYIASGTILVKSPDIPTDLVRPTVVSLPTERIEIIRQRIMTRDNLLALAKKFNIKPGWREQFSGTDIVDFIRARTLIDPVDVKLPGKNSQAIAFKVGFDYENPVIATKVANELMTMILQEDATTRSASASETTKFIQAHVQRLEAELALLDSRIADMKRRRAAALSADIDGSDVAGIDITKTLDSLKAQLLLKRASLSDSHPDIRMLKRKIAALEKEQKESDEKPSSKAKKGISSGNAKNGKVVDIGTLQAKRDSLAKELDSASQKLTAARQGENLERGQHAERFEVIEQPTVPTQSIKPNRTKLFVAALALAFMVGGAFAGGTEFMSGAVRRVSDLRSIIDPATIVSIPYITTPRELRSRRTKRILKVLLVVAILIGGAVAVYFYIPDPDLLADKLMQHIAK